VGSLMGGEVSEAFLRFYFESASWMGTHWLGTRVIKCPFDLWMYQEILFRTRPDAIVETGTLYGGSALFMASICDQLSGGRVITIDVKEQEGRPQHDRITYINGSSVSPDVLAELRAQIASNERVMVVLDSKHSKEHVLAELRAYAPLVTEGCYLIVEDTAAARLASRDHGPGPAEAVEEFLGEGAPFVVDRACEKFYVTFQPGGYLRRVSDRSRKARRRAPGTRTRPRRGAVAT
jgi:cephalosporin hydroxylase